MNVVFLGAGPFALPSLEILAASRYVPKLVITSPDKPTGRGRKLMPGPVKAWAAEHRLKVDTPADVNAAAYLEKLKKISADVFAVVSFGTIFSEKFLDLPPRGCLNVHASLLPLYRGASPIAAALQKGDAETGVTLMRLASRMDAGDILLQERLPLTGDENAADVTGRLAAMGARLLVRGLDLMEKNALTPRPQDHARATYAPKLKKEDGRIDWKLTAREIHNRVRAFYVWPGSRTVWNGAELTILKTVPDEDVSASPGTVDEVSRSRGIRVAAGRGSLWILELKPPGKKAMSCKDFLNGHKLKVGDQLS